MKSILGRVADFSGNNPWNIFLSRSLSPRTINSLQRGPKLWICRRCYHLNQNIQPSKSIKQTNSLISRPPKSRWNRLQDFSTSRSVRQAESIDDKNTKTTARNELPSAEEGRRSQISKRFTHLMDHVQSNIFIAGQRLNDLTGYSGIEALKKDIEQQEQLVKSTRASLQSAREAYSKAINQRSGSQREVNELLQRKHGWSPEDLERFTTLYRSDHANEQAEAAAQENLANAEREAEEAGARLSSCILARYHEEQIWSDKIRRMSTWGTWGLMGVNILLFLVFQIAVEPWRRKRLVTGFEEKVMEALEREGSTTGVASTDEVVIQDLAPVEIEDDATPKSATEEPLGEVSLPLKGVPLLANNVTGVQPNTSSETPSAKPLSRLESISAAFQDMFSERQITVRRVDLTTAMLEGTAAGLAFVGVLVLVLRPR